MHAKHVVYRLNIANNFEKIRRRSVYVKIVERDIAVRIIETIYCRKGMSLSKHALACD